MKNVSFRALAVVLAAVSLIGCSDSMFTTLRADVYKATNNIQLLTIVAADHGSTSPLGTAEVKGSEPFAITAAPYSGYRFSE